MRVRGRTMHVAVTIGVDGMRASWPGGTERWSHLFDPAAELRESVMAGFGVLERDASKGRSFAALRLTIALLPPLAMVRRIELPRMSDRERRSVVRRNAERWFLDAREPLTTAYQARAGRRGAPSSVIVDTARAALVTLLYDQAAARGWIIELVVPAVVAWHAFATSRWPALRNSNGSVLVREQREWLLLQMSRGELQLVRRFRVGDLTGLGGIDREELADPVDAALQGLRRPSPLARALELLPEQQRTIGERAITRVASGIVAIAAGLLIAAAGFQRVGLHRELAAVRVARQAQHARVERALALRDSAAMLSSRLEALAKLERESPRWSAVIAQIASHLPDDAHLAGFRASGDSLFLDGQARDAAGVFTAMHDAPGLGVVSAAAPIRQEVVPGQPTVEHWTMLARVGGADR